MAATLVETDRTWARTVARIDPAWIEAVGAHVIKRSHSDPWWDRARAEALTEERVTLYGLPVIAARQVSLADRPGRSQEHVHRPGSDRIGRTTSMPALEVTHDRMAQIEELGRRSRRGDLLAGDQVLRSFYDSRLPPDVTGGRSFERWWGRARKATPDILDVPLDVLLNRDAAPLDVSAFPGRWLHDDVELRVRYVYEPGSPDDGVTVEVPLAALNRVRSSVFQWQVPGRREELVTELVRSLPKAVRRSLPSPTQAAKLVLAGAGPEDGSLLTTVAVALSRLSGETVSPEMWAPDPVPEHLVVAFEVIDGNGRIRARGRDLDALRDALSGEIRAALAELAPELERHGAKSWDFAALPRRVDRGSARGYPALVDEVTTVGVGVFETPEAQAESMWQGTRRLLLLGAPVAAAHVERRLSPGHEAGGLPIGGSRRGPSCRLRHGGGRPDHRCPRRPGI